MKFSIGIGDIVRFNKTVAGFERQITGKVIRGPSEMYGKTFWSVEITRPRHQVFTLNENEILEVVHEKKGNISVPLEKALFEQYKKSAVVEIGSKVTIKNLDTEEEREYQIVEPGLHSPNSKLVGADKPIARAVIGCFIGDKFKLNGIEREVIGIVPPPEKSQNVSSIEGNKISNVFETDFGEKNDFIKSSPETRSFVQAGPGTGKSFCLAHKVACLIEKHGISPSNILILSFSREAVAEVKRRLAQFKDERVAYAAPVTIDSFASSILIQHSSDSGWMDRSYENNIIQATKYLKEFSERYFQHVFIDEVQDVVGVRAEFIFSLISTLPKTCGFSLLGDFNQAVYDWTLDTDISPEFQINSHKLKNKLLTEIAFDQKISLTKQFRRKDKSSLIIETEKMISELENCSTPAEQIMGQWVRLLETIPNVESLGSTKYEVNNFLYPDKILKKVLLVRTNGQIIGEQDEAIKGKFGVRLLGKYSKGLLPAWVAMVLYDTRLKNPVMDFQEFKKHFDLIEFKEGWEADEAFQLLKFIEKEKFSSYVDIRRLKKNLKSIKDIPLSTQERERIDICGLTLATIHCSKGLEFDGVAMVEPEFSRIKNENDLLAALKLFYVGITRSKGEVRLINSKSLAQFYCLSENESEERPSRWYKGQKGRELKFNVDLEEDVEGFSFITDYDFHKVEEIQYHLQVNVKPGQQVWIIKQKSPSGDLRYFIQHSGIVLGCMSLSFFNSMKNLESRTRISINRIQAEIGKVYTEYRFDPIYSHRVDPEYTNSAETWLAVKLKGLAMV